jgi:alpha-galactosidase
MPPLATLTTATLHRTFNTDTDGLYTSTLVFRPTQTDYLAAACAEDLRTPEFDLRVNGRRITSLSPACAHPTVTQADGRLSLLLTLADPALTVTLDYEGDPDFPVLHKRLSVRNDGAATITLSHVCVEDLLLRAGDTRDWQLFAHYGALPRELLFTGRVDEPLLRLHNPRTGATILALNGAAGHCKRTESGAWFWDGQLRWMYDTDLFPFVWTLAPDETWTSDPMGLAFAQADTAYDPRWLLPGWGAARLPRKGKAYRAPWQYNTWDPFGTGIDEATVRALIPLAARMGFEVFTIDDGWQADYGDNAVSALRFPAGMDAIRAQVEAAGMRLGLWASLAAVAPSIADAQPDWICRDAQGAPKTTMTAQGEQIVMCLASPFAESAARRLIDLVGRYHLAYLKLDLTTMFNAYGEPPGCHAHGHSHASSAESIPRIYTAIAEVCEQVHAAHPDVLIDLTFELWGQKHSVDYALLRAADQSWMSNVGDNRALSAGARQARLLLYQRALALPVETLLIGNLRIDTGDLREKLAMAMGSAPLLLGDLRTLTEAQLEQCVALIGWHRALRGDVLFTEGFFVLGSATPDASAWEGFARLSRSGEGMIALFRNASGAPAATVRLPLLGDAIYRLMRLDAAGTPQPYATVSAADFRAGVALPFGEEEGVLLLALRII